VYVFQRRMRRHFFSPQAVFRLGVQTLSAMDVG
jgi:hypothetical protein